MPRSARMRESGRGLTQTTLKLSPPPRLNISTNFPQCKVDIVDIEGLRVKIPADPLVHLLVFVLRVVQRREQPCVARSGCRGSRACGRGERPRAQSCGSEAW